MEEYKGKISGIGNVTTRENEITADDLATLRNYFIGWEYGIVNRSGWNFNAYKDGNNVVVEKGIMFAYGYFGILPKSITLPFIKPSATQYRFIYAEIDRSIVPNTFKIKIKNNQNSNKIKPTTFRQDYLTAIKTGVFQLPLWMIELNNIGIVKISDLRKDLNLFRDNIMQVEKSNITKKVINKLGSFVTTYTQNIDDISKKVATTKFVDNLVKHTIGGDKLWVFSYEIQNTTTASVKILPKTLYFDDVDKKANITKKTFSVFVPLSVYVRFSTDLQQPTAEIIEDEITVIYGDTEKTIIVPVQIHGFPDNGTAKGIITMEILE